MPERPEELTPGEKMGDGGNGVLFIGDKGKLMCGIGGGSRILLPSSRFKDFVPPAKTIPRIEGGINKNFARACKGLETACSNFDYSGPMTESIVMGDLAIRYPMQKMEWDGASMTVTNVPEANDFVKTHYREGWSL